MLLAEAIRIGRFAFSFAPLWCSISGQTILKMKTPRYRVFKSKTSSVPVFSTNWKFLAQCYVSYFCKNYARIEKFVGDKYQTVLEIAYAIVVTNN
jgi:hypothetical protein